MLLNLPVHASRINVVNEFGSHYNLEHSFFRLANQFDSQKSVRR